MVNFSIDGHIDQGNVRLARVWYSSNAALGEGEGVNYNWNYGTATDREPRRYNEVETPTTANSQHFAGVSAGSHLAVSGGQFIDIYLPGSVCNIKCGKDTDTVIGVGLLTFDVTSGFEGEFRYAGLPGAGSARPLQTTTGDASDPGLCLAYLMEGPQSGGVEVVTAVNGALSMMVGGSSRIVGAAIGGNCTFVLADGGVAGLRKHFIQVDTDLSSNDIVITVTTGMRQDGTALQTVTWNNAQTTLNFGVVLEWAESWAVTSLGDGEPDLA